MSLFITRTARKRLDLDPSRFGSRGSVSLEGFASAYALADVLRRDEPESERRPLEGHDLAALDLLQDLAAGLVDRVIEEGGADLLAKGVSRLQHELEGEPGGDLARLAGELNLVPVDEESTEGSPSEEAPPESDSSQDCVRELLVVSILSVHPLAARILDRLGFDAEENPVLGRAVSAAGGLLEEMDLFASEEGGSKQRLLGLVGTETSSFRESIEQISRRWGRWLKDERQRLAAVSGLLAEAATFRGEPGHDADAGIGLDDGPAAYSADSRWMSELVLLAKNVLVWLDQLSRRHGRQIERLDQIPTEELEEIARRGFTGLWLIGVWERSEASRRLKQMRGQYDAAASAYSVRRYRIAPELGGEAALEALKRRASRLGIRLAADFVPNHTSIDSDWVIEHPERFISVSEPPFPGYSFGGEQLSPDPRVSIKVEDHYWDHSDAAVVFERRDHHSGDARYIYHGNDGTSIPWNDTAQLDYADPETRRAALEGIVAVARQFPILRFDAAMTLTRQHFHRLWYPAPDAAGAIPSRAEHGLSSEAMARRMPQEFWREVVLRLQREAPDTLLLAEAFWLMEGYFVRRLGLHRVYNSAFMHMLRDGDTAKLRGVLLDTISVDARLLERFVNYLSNPDEETAAGQFGRGDRYVGACRVLATLPGLPLFAHGQWEGLAEKYGMEFQGARSGETEDEHLIGVHDREIAPLLARRDLFCPVERFRLLRLVNADGWTMDCVLAYANQHQGECVVVAFNNADQPVSGRLEEIDVGRPKIGWGDLAEQVGAGDFRELRDFTGTRTVRFDPRRLEDEGLQLELAPWECAVLVDAGPVDQ